MMAKLTKIETVADLRELQELYLQDWPNHCVGYFWLDNYLRWLDKNSVVEQLVIFTLNSNWRQDGLFFLLHRYQLFFSNLSRQKTHELLTAMKLWDWSVGCKVSAIHQKHHEILRELVTERKLCLQREMGTLMYSIPCKDAKALRLSCPAGYYLDSVRLEHAELINKLWSARHDGSLELIKMLIENNISVGLYEQETGKLCAWCLRLQSGFLGALEVLQTHQRRGLAVVVAAAISKRIASELNHDVTALVNMSNVAACRVFDKLGFNLQKGDHYYWSMCLPDKDSSLNSQFNHNKLTG